MFRFTALAIVLLVCCTGYTRQALALGIQANVTSTASDSVAEFQKLEDSWSNAINSRDQYSLENVLSPLFLDVAASGDITTRNQQIAFLISGEDKTLHLEQKVITVRMMGDSAVINGTYVLHHRTDDGPVDDKGVFTHVYERTHDRWVCVNSQRTLVREVSTDKRKKSKADQPFHIPLFSRSDK